MDGVLESISHDTLHYFLRIAILICGYIVVRPLIEACFRRFMTPQDAVDKLGTKTPRQKSLADELLVDSAEEDADQVDEESIHDTNSRDKAEWGGSLRKQQKAKFMEAWEEEEARLAEEEELRELDDILED